MRGVDNEAELSNKASIETIDQIRQHLWCMVVGVLLLEVKCTGIIGIQGRSQGGAQGARAPPLSCRAMTSYERRLATHVRYFKGHLLVGVTYLQLAVLRADQFYHNVAL